MPLGPLYLYHVHLSHCHVFSFWWRSSVSCSIARCKGKPWAHCMLEMTQVLLQGQGIEVGKKRGCYKDQRCLQCSVLALPVTASLHRMLCLKEIKPIGRMWMIQADPQGSGLKKGQGSYSTYCCTISCTSWSAFSKLLSPTAILSHVPHLLQIPFLSWSAAHKYFHAA